MLLAGVALPASAYAQCVINAPAVDACLGGVRINGPSLPPGVTLDLNFMQPGTLDPRITFTRASGAAYIDASGFIQMATVNAPRWDYDPVTHALRGVLIEEQRTNTILNSDTMDPGSGSINSADVARLKASATSWKYTWPAGAANDRTRLPYGLLLGWA